ncbi:MAG: RsmD family RNA methyltransferase, partial [Phycisphaerales bacterium]
MHEERRHLPAHQSHGARHRRKRRRELSEGLRHGRRTVAARILAAVQSRVVIMGGEHRSRVLRTPAGADVTRPMTGRVKESIFNILRGWFDDAVV